MNENESKMQMIDSRRQSHPYDCANADENGSGTKRMKIDYSTTHPYQQRQGDADKANGKPNGYDMTAMNGDVTGRNENGHSSYTDLKGTQVNGMMSHNLQRHRNEHQNYGIVDGDDDDDDEAAMDTAASPFLRHRPLPNPNLSRSLRRKRLHAPKEFQFTNTRIGQVESNDADNSNSISDSTSTVGAGNNEKEENSTITVKLEPVSMSSAVSSASTPAPEQAQSQPQSSPPRAGPSTSATPSASSTSSTHTISSNNATATSTTSLNKSSDNQSQQQHQQSPQLQSRSPVRLHERLNMAARDGLCSGVELHFALSASDRSEILDRYNVLVEARSKNKRSNWLPNRLREEQLSLSIAQSQCSTKFRSASAVDTMMQSVSAPMTNVKPSIILHLYQQGFTLNHEEKNFHLYKNKYMREFIRCVDSGEMPYTLTSMLLHTPLAKHVQFFDGAILCELRDYRNLSILSANTHNHTENWRTRILQPTIKRVLLRPTNETVQQSCMLWVYENYAYHAKNILKSKINELTDRELREHMLQMESQLLLRTRSDICLQRNVKVTQILNLVQYNRLKSNVRKLSRQGLDDMIRDAVELVDDDIESQNESTEASKQFAVSSKRKRTHNEWVESRREWLRLNHPKRQRSTADIADAENTLPSTFPSLGSIDVSIQYELGLPTDDDFLRTEISMDEADEAIYRVAKVHGLLDDELLETPRDRTESMQQLLSSAETAANSQQSTAIPSLPGRSVSLATSSTQPRSPARVSLPLLGRAASTTPTTPTSASTASQPSANAPPMKLSDRGMLFDPPPTGLTIYTTKWNAHNYARENEKHMYQKKANHEIILLQYMSYVHHNKTAARDEIMDSMIAQNNKKLTQAFEKAKLAAQQTHAASASTSTSASASSPSAPAAEQCKDVDSASVPSSSPSHSTSPTTVIPDVKPPTLPSSDLLLMYACRSKRINLNTTTNADGSSNAPPIHPRNRLIPAHRAVAPSYHHLVPRLNEYHTYSYITRQKSSIHSLVVQAVPIDSFASRASASAAAPIPTSNDADYRYIGGVQIHTLNDNSGAKHFLYMMGNLTNAVKYIVAFRKQCEKEAKEAQKIGLSTTSSPLVKQQEDEVVNNIVEAWRTAQYSYDERIPATQGCLSAISFPTPQQLQQQQHLLLQQQQALLRAAQQPTMPPQRSLPSVTPPQQLSNQLIFGRQMHAQETQRQPAQPPPSQRQTQPQAQMPMPMHRQPSQAPPHYEQAQHQMVQRQPSAALPLPSPSQLQTAPSTARQSMSSIAALTPQPTASPMSMPPPTRQPSLNRSITPPQQLIAHSPQHTHAHGASTPQPYPGIPAHPQPHAPQRIPSTPPQQHQHPTHPPPPAHSHPHPLQVHSQSPHPQQQLPLPPPQRTYPPQQLATQPSSHTQMLPLPPFNQQSTQQQAPADTLAQGQGQGHSHLPMPMPPHQQQAHYSMHSRQPIQPPSQAPSKAIQPQQQYDGQQYRAIQNLQQQQLQKQSAQQQQQQQQPPTTQLWQQSPSPATTVRSSSLTPTRTPQMQPQTHQQPPPLTQHQLQRQSSLPQAQAQGQGQGQPHAQPHAISGMMQTAGVSKMQPTQPQQMGSYVNAAATHRTMGPANTASPTSMQEPPLQQQPVRMQQQSPSMQPSPPTSAPQHRHPQQGHAHGHAPPQRMQQQASFFTSPQAHPLSNPASGQRSLPPSAAAPSIQQSVANRQSLPQQNLAHQVMQMYQQQQQQQRGNATMHHPQTQQSSAAAVAAQQYRAIQQQQALAASQFQAQPQRNLQPPNPLSAPQYQQQQQHQR